MLRCVVREDLSYEMATDLIDDMNKCIEWLDHHFIYSGEFPALSSLPTARMSSLMSNHTSHKLVALIQVWLPYNTEGTNAEMLQTSSDSFMLY